MKTETKDCDGRDRVQPMVLCKDRLPELNEVVTVTGLDTWGEFEMKVSRKPYKLPQKGGRTWRWVNEHGENLSRKELPESWTPNENNEGRIAPKENQK